MNVLSLIIVGLALLGLVLMSVKLLVGRLSSGGVENRRPETPAVAAPPSSDREKSPIVPPQSTGSSRPGDSTALLDDKNWLMLVQECVALYEELDRHSERFDPANQELAEHVRYRLQEILERSSVKTIVGEIVFDRNRHQADQAASAPPGAIIAETLSPGFAVGRRVLRRARVRLADSSVPTTTP